MGLLEGEVLLGWTRIQEAAYAIRQAKYTFKILYSAHSK